jgi:hypothetical protein
MSVAVSVERLGEQVALFGAWPYLVTVGADGRPHAVSASFAWDGTAFHGSAGRHSRTNAADRPSAVTLLWPPYEPGGYSLLVDGSGAGGPDESLTITPTTAVLHRTGPPREDAGPNCTSDCVPLTAVP